MNKTIVNPIIKDEVTFIQTSAATNGRVTTLQVMLMPGGGTPLHYHRNFSETFVVIEGALTILVDNKTITLHSGQKITVNRGVPHRFSNESFEPVVFTTIVQPGSEGFENALKILYGLAGDRKTNEKGVPKSLVALAVVSKISDMHLPGPALIVAPLMSLLNFIARITGLKKKLVAAYCQD